MSEAFIYDSVRTPRGKGQPQREDKAGGALSHLNPQELVSQLVDAMEARNGSQALKHVGRLVLGCVGQTGAQGGHMALVARLYSSLPDNVHAKTINNFCVSGLTAIGDACLWARAGENTLSLAGGVEMLSQVPFQADRASYYTQPGLMKKLKWALPVIGAEVLANVKNIPELDMDTIPFASHQRANFAWDSGYYDNGVISIKNSDGSVALARDELIKPELSLHQIRKTPPVFGHMSKAAGYEKMVLEDLPALKELKYFHNRYHCPPVADGAALALIGSEQAGRDAGLQPKARILAYAEACSDPVLQFTGGLSAMDMVMAQTGLRLSDFDLIEFMEAFAAVPALFFQRLDVDRAKVNVNGGHLAMGHPMGASGAILVNTALHELQRRGQRRALIVCHAGSGVGNAAIIERL